ncbi:MAG: hypothetical protein HY722_00225 [Planctomycetes bacterium]|nr:hypothetical protein [Planctomycetota bacterium]
MGFNINKAVDKKFETKSLNDILAAPPSALQGLTPEADKALAQVGIKTVRDLGEWKYANWARTVNDLAKISQ